MTKKLLVIASSLLFIVGCESAELGRCIEANTSKFAIGDVSDTSDEIFNIVQQHPLSVASREKSEAAFNEYYEMGCKPGEGESDICLAKRLRVIEQDEVSWREAADAVTEELATEYCNSQGIY